MKNKKEHNISIKDLVKICIDTKVPILLFIISLILPMVIGLMGVEYTAYLSRIAGGDVNDPQLIKSFVLYAILAALLIFPKSVMDSIVSYIYLSKAQKSVLSKIIKLPMKYFDKSGSFGLIGRFINDVPQFVQKIYALWGLIPQVIIIYKPFTYLYYENKILAISLMLYGAVEIIVAYYTGAWLKNANIKFYGAYSLITSFFTERINLLKYIKTSATEEEEISIAMKNLEYTYEKELILEVQIFKTNLIKKFLAVTKKSGMYVIGAILMSRGMIDLSGVMMMITMAAMVDSSMLSLMAWALGYQSLKGTSYELSNILNSEEELVKRKYSMQKTVEDISFENVTFAYDDKEILKNINLMIPKGKVTAIVGPSGSGKTTILKMIERFYNTNNGSIKLGTVDIEDIHLDEWRKSFGFIVQNNQLLEGSIKENICYGASYEVDEEELIKVAKMANIYDFILTLPDGFDSPATKLSTGQTQRVSIARALMANPNYLILDEATSNIDVENEYDIMNSLKDFMKNKTTIVVAHKLSTIKNADQIILVDNGHVVGCGKHKELRENNELYKKFCEIQSV